MKIAHTLLVKNEVDIIRQHLEYHLSRGVDPLIVTDNGSSDGTLEVLKEYAKKNKIVLLEESGDNMDQSRWVTRMARMAFDDYGADWVINSDTDEFWWPVNGSLEDALSEVEPEVDVISIRRYNFLPRPKSEGGIFERMIYKDMDSRNALDKPLHPKVIHRGRADIVLEHGNHKVKQPSNLEVQSISDIEIFHFPLRSYRQFERKIVQGAEALSRNDSLNRMVGITWREMYDQYTKGTLTSKWQSALDQSINSKMADGPRIVIDHRLHQYLEKIGSQKAYTSLWDQIVRFLKK